MVNAVTIAAYRRIYWLRLIGLVQRSLATWRCVLYSSDEPGELLQSQCHDESTTNIVMAIMWLGSVTKGRGFNSGSGRYRVVTTYMSDWQVNHLGI